MSAETDLKAALARLYASTNWPALETVCRLMLEDRKVMLCNDMPEADTANLRGQIATLRRFLKLQEEARRAAENV